ncbi:hypothetical protein RM531_13980 [Salinisphaera sp. P385]|uniref:Uncharacterized protein n=1 Tax=Spectribacter acetivorans TaxID=3075603 RepID=A0ABU3BAS6_9GAMM|nr:hypothetical protein [Salinisphaera sp. P385]MDT0619582.1 hypothetical protein [Salinisphaera sp. P385]
MQAEHIVHFRFGWPIGMKLRIRPAECLPAEYQHLGGCLVIVTGLASRPVSGISKQFVYLLQGRDERFSSERIRPEDLELIPDLDPVAYETNQAVVAALPDMWFRRRRTRRQGQSGA